MAFGDFTVDRNSTKYVLGSGGDIISYATDEPAFEFNTDGSYKGLLVEPAATNICKQSEDLSTTWTDTNATPTAVNDETPDGDTSSKFIKLVDDNTGGGATGPVRINQNITVSAGTKYTASVFLKADQLTFAAFEASGYDGATTGYQYFGLSGAGSKGTAVNLDDSSIEAYPNDWYRCSITFTAGNTSFNYRIYVADSISNTTVDLDGSSSIFVWGAQLETGPIATSYIPTTTASVTRNKDDILLGSASSLIGQTEGTLYIEVDWRATSATYLLTASDGTSSNRILIYNDSTNLVGLAIADGSTVGNVNESSTGFSGIQKIAIAYANGDQELYRNGSSIATATGSLAALATLTDIDLGQRENAANQANMWIRAAALFTRRLSDAEAQALTTL